ncbi:ABC transporter substrate-binding protein [Ktedonobacter robiniae]|uniref:ABC transporter substrate-binding protein n=1 Tax=Ktedonobacter robiniae TaxID=2778365 RepID=UPI0019157736|nr:extracellular solute-binding protein [Ktedonobacter robiniae]
MKTYLRRTPLYSSLIVVLLLMLTACGGTSSGNTSGQTLHVLVGANTTYPTQQKQWMQQIGTEFNKLTGSTIAWDTYSSSSEEQTKLQTAIVSGNGPDIFSLGTTFVPTAQATNGFVTLSDADWQQVGGKSKFFPQQLTMAGKTPDQTIGIPWIMAPFAMVYNKDLFQKAGITTPPTTWTEFIQDAQKINQPSAGVYGTEIDPSDSFDTWKVIWTLSKQLGKDFLSPDLKTAQLNSPEAQTALQFWFDWATKYKITDPNAMSWKSGDATRAFGSGKVGMQLMVSTSIIPTLDKSGLAGHYAFAPMPTVPYGMQQRPANGIAATSIVSGQMLAIAKYSNQKDLALKLINLLTDNQHQLDWHKTFGDLPANAAAANQLASQDALTAAFIQAEAGATPTPFSGSWASIQVSMAGVCSKVANLVATNQYSPSSIKPLLDQANQQIQGSLH